MIWKRLKIESKRPDPDIRFCYEHVIETYKECVRVRFGNKNKKRKMFSGMSHVYLWEKEETKQKSRCQKAVEVTDT